MRRYVLLLRMLSLFIKNSIFENVLRYQVTHRKVALCAQTFSRGLISPRSGLAEKALVTTRSREVFYHMTIVTNFNAMIVYT